MKIENVALNGVVCDVISTAFFIKFLWNLLGLEKKIETITP